MTATPAEPSPSAVEPAAVPPPAVPYGPPMGESGVPLPSAEVTIDLSTRSVAGTAGKWALRLLVPLLIRAIFRAIFR